VPNFVGAREATERLQSLPEWRQARTVFAAPDAPLHPAREIALSEGKALLVAAPRLTGFYLLKGIPPIDAFAASAIKGFARLGRRVEPGPAVPNIDLYLTGAVAVDMRGNRIGKGAGYGDREDEILTRAGLLDTATPRIVLVHAAQVFDDFSRLMEVQDRKVSVIVTPEKIIWVG
jgi:5-formyltetrahydrofolate cyclo-ligase